ncbi:MAG: YggS family pyridoxal phosphate-dependent enzyme [Deltaproteobacteria bacterium]|nr:YggS family pyridoxal phosphate-dependent enzyme [Deltaproteobacteria bacterium]
MALSIADNYASVRERIHRAARKSGRGEAEIKLVCVTKTVDVKLIKDAIKAGAGTFGENYVQEAEKKIKALSLKHVDWHMIGHLQKNKAKFAVKLFNMVESVDSPELADILSKKAETPLDILIEVNLAREKTKTGIDPAKLDKALRKISEMKNVRVKGLMAVPPFHDSAEHSRPYFQTLRRLAERINKEHIPNIYLTDLSMGMSADFDVAIEEGATIVRVGTAIFGERKKKDQ